MSPQMFDAIPFQLLNPKMAERKTRPVNKIQFTVWRDPVLSAQRSTAWSRQPTVLYELRHVLESGCPSGFSRSLKRQHVN
jgi:hypothetical protein